ncbi:hypothetical protein JCM10908_006052 [Rhodotorula pacifica]|uniref:uncharacterized protein n=1 Tax=Rhodotorula pacifica TaxID=1495444 RepID=UPI003172CE52
MEGTTVSQAEVMAPAPSMVLPEPLPEVTKIVHAPTPRRRTARHHAVGFLHSPDGRDAALRLFQYTLRLALTYRGRTRHRKAHERLLAVVSLLAALRRVAALHKLLASLCSLSPTGVPSFARPARPPNDIEPSPSPAVADRRTKQDWLDSVTRIACQSLDVTALLAANVYLFSRLGLLPLSLQTSKRADKLSDCATLLAASIGLASLARKRAQLYRAGEQARRKAMDAETKLEELDFWEHQNRPAGGKADEADQTTEAGPVPPTSAEQELKEERGQLRDRVRQERRTLRLLRQDLGDLWWERLRLGADGLFALYDALEVSVASESVKSLAGITSAGIEFSQAWIEHLGGRRSV